MISTRQHARYIFHSFPFFVLSLAFATQNIAVHIESNLAEKRKIMIHHDWLFADMQRYYRISLTPDLDQPYLIIAKNSQCTVPEGYQKIHQQPTIKYLLYQKAHP